MPLKTYKKAMPAYVALTTPDYFYIQPMEQPLSTPPNMWSLLAGVYRGLKGIVATSTAAGLVIPAVFILGGLLVLYRQALPTIADQVKAASGYYDQGTTALVGNNYIADRLKYISNPGSDYFSNISKALSGQSTSIDQAVTAYDGTMYLTIPALGFNRLPVSANVESNVKEVYDQILTSSLAHFKGTSLPINTNPGNTVIYGHSASGSYNPTPEDVLAAFTFLSDLKAGDAITLEMNGTVYNYRMSKSKIVKPEDVSVLESQGGKDILTLITCYPPGNNSQRYVATATKVN